MHIQHPHSSRAFTLWKVVSKLTLRVLVLLLVTCFWARSTPYVDAAEGQSAEGQSVEGQPVSHQTAWTMIAQPNRAVHPSEHKLVQVPVDTPPATGLDNSGLDNNGLDIVLPLDITITVPLPVPIPLTDTTTLSNTVPPSDTPPVDIPPVGGPQPWPFSILEYNPAYALALTNFHGVDLEGKDGPLSKLGFDLTLLHAEYSVYADSGGANRTNMASDAATAQSASTSASDPFQTTIPLLRVVLDDGEVRVWIDAVAANGGAALLADLEDLGLTYGEYFGAVVSGAIPIHALSQVADLPTLRFVQPVLLSTQAGEVESQGVKALGADIAHKQYGVDGKGIVVGIISDSYDCLQSANVDMENGDLPVQISVLLEEAECSSGRDEGRAMMQIVTDVAPASSQSFHTAFHGRASFANAFIDLAAEGADVIVDDVIYFTEPMFQHGIVAQAVKQVWQEGIPVFTSAGNYGRQAYESAFASTAEHELDYLPESGTLHNFATPLRVSDTDVPDTDVPDTDVPDTDPSDVDPSDVDPSDIDVFQSITIPAGESAAFILQWDQPYASASGGTGSASDLDLFLIDPSNQIHAFSIDNNIGANPVEVMKFRNSTAETHFDLIILHRAGPLPQLMKYIFVGSATLNEYQTYSGTVFGHGNSAAIQTIGAVSYFNTPAFGEDSPVLESFSSYGSTPILFDAADQPISIQHSKPNVAAPNRGNTTFFGRDISDPGDGSDMDSHPNFSGTSAAAPHVAGVAALLLQRAPSIQPETLYALLECTAYPMNENGAGAGLVAVDVALELLPLVDETDPCVDFAGVPDGDSATPITAPTPEPAQAPTPEPPSPDPGNDSGGTPGSTPTSPNSQDDDADHAIGQFYRLYIPIAK